MYAGIGRPYIAARTIYLAYISTERYVDANYIFVWLIVDNVISIVNHSYVFVTRLLKKAILVWFECHPLSEEILIS